MIKKIYCSVFLLLVICRSFAQDISAQLPQPIPVTPTAAHLIKVGMGDINKATGAATAAFPLYELNVGNIKLPVSLNYFSQGNKAEEQCTRAGFGWSLSAGGVITRKVNGAPDELSPRMTLPTDLTAHSSTLLAQFYSVRNSEMNEGGYDSQPDEFMFSFNGYSGKFYIDDAGNPVVLSHQNLKININHSSSTVINFITIITPDGSTYYFGGENYDRITNHHMPYIKTAFYLYKIVSASGQTIDLNYSRIYTKSLNGFSESVVFSGSCEPYFGGVGGNYLVSHNYSSQYTETDGSVLTNVTSSEGTTIDFSYENMPDISGDKRITAIYVHNQNGAQIKHFVFGYNPSAPPSSPSNYVNNYPNGPMTQLGGKNGRFYLTHVMEKYFIDDDEKSIDYPIEYYGDINNEILTNIYSQDDFGFKNGKSNQTLLGPPEAYFLNATNSIVWANKNPDWNASVIGMLRKITYPTKGAEEFFYEANTVAATEPNPPDPRSLIFSVRGGTVPQTHTETIFINHDQTVHLNIATFTDPNNCSFGPGKFMTLTVTDVLNNTHPIGASLIYEGYGPFDTYFQVQGGHSYTFTTSLYPTASTCVHATITVLYDATLPGTNHFNKEIGGVRVRKITQSDQFGAKLSKFFYYNSLSDRINSSALAPLNISANTMKRGWYCYPSTPDVGGPQTECFDCQDPMYTSNGSFNILRMDNSHIYYDKIIIADDSLLNNGGTEYTFYDPVAPIEEMIRRGSSTPHAPIMTNPPFDGMIQKELVFDKDLNPKTVTENNYELINGPHPYLRTISVNKMYDVHWTTSVEPDLNLESELNSFDVAEAWYRPGWMRLHDTKATKYDKYGHTFETNIAYDYNTPDNVLPVSVTTTDSKEQPLITYKKYPTDFPVDPVSVAMVNANMITPLVEEFSFRNTTQTAHTNLVYANNGSAGGGFQPAKVQQMNMQTNVMEDKVIFSAYDNKGNLKEVSKANDGKISYLYDYHQSLVTAEVKNTVKENIAYTSFEADAKGNFTYNGTPDVDLSAPTGKKAYNLSNGAISFPSTLNLTKSYIVSYWSKDGYAKTINGVSATRIGRSVGTWKYIEHTINIMPAGNSISGSGTIDELRVYPADAIMSTYTYEPLIGQTSVCDINNRITYYEYDGFNRLSIIRNQDKNIVKKICYNYAGQPEDCSGLFSNAEKSGTFTRNNCGAGATGSTLVYTVPAGTYTGTSQAAADAQAQQDIDNNGQAYANIHGTCTNLFGNAAIGNSWIRNDCGAGYIGSQVYFSVPANIYYASTQAAADAQASTYLNANGQAYANAHGTCTAYTCAMGTNCFGPDHKCISNSCELGTKCYTTSQRVKINNVWQFQCTYVWVFSDNSYSASYTEYNATACTTGTCDQD